MRFSLDVHIAVINDVKHILNNVYGDKVEFVTGLCRSTGMCCIRKARGEIHNREHVAVFELRDDQRFRRRVSGIFLSTFDGFIVTHNPSFVLLYESFNKPIIVVNTCRYEQPYSFSENNDLRGWKTLND
jgi:hypothetical protein